MSAEPSNIVSRRGITRKTFILLAILVGTTIGFWEWIAPSIHDDVIGNHFAMIGIIAPFISFFLVNRIMNYDASAKIYGSLVAFLMGTFLALICGVAEMSSSSRGLVPLALAATFLSALTLTLLVHWKAETFNDKFFENSFQAIRLLLTGALIDCSLTILIGNYQSIYLSENPFSYGISFGLVFMGYLVFLYCLKDIEQQIKDRTSDREEWDDAFLLMISTLWIFIASFFVFARFGSRGRR